MEEGSVLGGAKFLTAVKEELEARRPTKGLKCVGCMQTSPGPIPRGLVQCDRCGYYLQYRIWSRDDEGLDLSKDTQVVVTSEGVTTECAGT